MEELSRRVPFISQLILKNADEKSRVNFKHASRVIYQLLEKDRMFWILMMNKYRGNFEEFKESWKTVTSRTQAHDIKKLALAVQKFFNGKATRIDQQWNPLHITAERVSLDLCKFIIEKTGEINPKRSQDGITPLHLAIKKDRLEVYQK